ncbi:MAG: SMI1/KNR4 family protein [Candidatus Angelobacter sp.]
MPEFLKRYALGPELFNMLQKKNGFYAFESALHVFPIRCDLTNEMDLETWNSDTLWRNGYANLVQGLLFFAEDILQDQFCLSQQGVVRFKAETGETAIMAGSLEDWAGLITSNYQFETGWPLAHDWQASNGALPRGKRLMPETPFFLGGEYSVTNLWAGDALQGMRFKADIAIQTRDLPPGEKVRLRVGKPRQ